VCALIRDYYSLIILANLSVRCTKRDSRAIYATGRLNHLSGRDTGHFLNSGILGTEQPLEVVDRLERP
jgi:hypothetical protein